MAASSLGAQSAAEAAGRRLTTCEAGPEASAGAKGASAGCLSKRRDWGLGTQTGAKGGATAGAEAGSHTARTEGAARAGSKAASRGCLSTKATTSGAEATASGAEATGWRLCCAASSEGTAGCAEAAAAAACAECTGALKGLG